MFVKTLLNDKGTEQVAVLPISVFPDDLVQNVAVTFKRDRIGFAVVRDEQGPVIGSISERDIIHALASNKDMASLTAKEAMTDNVVTCGLDDTLDSVRHTMTQKRTRHVLVVDGEQSIGIVSIGDLVKHTLEQCKIDGDQMMEYINGQGYQ